MNKMVYFQTLKSTRDSLLEARKETFDLNFAGREKNPTIALVLSLFTGTFGIDRFYIGSILAGVLKLITIGGFGIWTIIDWFLIMGAARQKNIKIAKEVKVLIS